MESTIIISSVIIAIAIIFSARLYYSFKERSALIEKGLDPSLANIYGSGFARQFFLYGGILLLGVALGIITGILLASVFKKPGETKEFIYLSVLIFTGISCFICRFVSRSRKD